MTDIEKQMTNALAETLSKELQAPAPPPTRPLRAVAPAPLSDQLQAYERVRRELRDRVRREKLKLEHDYNSRRQEMLASHETKLHDTVNDLEQERDNDLAKLEQEFFDKARDIDALATRLGL